MLHTAHTCWLKCDFNIALLFLLGPPGDGKAGMYVALDLPNDGVSPFTEIGIQRVDIQEVISPHRVLVDGNIPRHVPV